MKDRLVVSRCVDCPVDKAITHRTILSFVSSVFDPVGPVALYTVSARLLLKEFRKFSGQRSHEKLPEDIRNKLLERHSGVLMLGQLASPSVIS